jgi:hypothetical protein
MFHRACTILFVASALAVTAVTANDPDKECVNACTDYSIVLGNCRNEHGNLREFSLAREAVVVAPVTARPRLARLFT